MRCRALAIITTLACLSYAGAGDAVALSPQSHLANPLVHRILPVKCTEAQKAACEKSYADPNYRKCILIPDAKARTPTCLNSLAYCIQRCGGS